MKILICPLNWGLGHATRCVPIINKLIAENHEVVIIADGFPLAFLQQEFPTLRTLEFPSYNIKYATSSSQILAMLWNLPKIIVGSFKEHNWLKKLLKSEKFDQIISDNRFGMWNKNIKSTYITHQLMVKMPRGLKFMELIVWYIHRIIIHQYDECRIPDIEFNGGLSDDLAHKYPFPKNANFIGAISRFQNISNLKPMLEYHQVAVLSGVEPQRSIFENQLIEKFRTSKFKSLIVQGQPQLVPQTIQIENLTIISHLASKELAEVFLGSEKIFARSGYSTIMDLHALNCLEKAELTPTPGQTEQEYLATIYKSINVKK